MKINLNLEILKKLFKRYQTLIITLAVILFVSAMAGGAYLALNPAEDQTTAQAGQSTVNSLNITFNHNTIISLEKEKAPTVVNGQAGRNPFLHY